MPSSTLAPLCLVCHYTNAVVYMTRLSWWPTETPVKFYCPWVSSMHITSQSLLSPPLPVRAASHRSRWFFLRAASWTRRPPQPWWAVTSWRANASWTLFSGRSRRVQLRRLVGAVEGLTSYCSGYNMWDSENVTVSFFTIFPSSRTKAALPPPPTPNPQPPTPNPQPPTPHPPPPTPNPPKRCLNCSTPPKTL